MDQQAAELVRITNQFVEVESLFESTYDQFYNAYVEVMFLEEKLDNGELSVDPLYASSIRDCRDYLREGIGTYMDIAPQMRSIGAQIGRVADALSDPDLPCYSAGGCECPDYTSLLSQIRSYLSTIQQRISTLLIDWEEFTSAHYAFYTSFGQHFQLSVIGDGSWSYEGDLGRTLGQYTGYLVSNVWASASPATFQFRTLRYSQYIDNDAPIDLEPEPSEVAADVPLVAIIGLLYRIQHKLYQTNVADVVSGWHDEYEGQVEEKEEEADAASEEISLDDVPEAPDDVFPFTDLFHIFEILNTALDEFLRNLPNVTIGRLIVVDQGGFYVNLGDTVDSLVGTSQTLHFSPVDRDDESSLSSRFILILAGLFSVIWYAFGGLVAFLLCQWLFKLLASFVALSFSVIAGDFSGAVKMLEKVGSHYAGD